MVLLVIVQQTLGGSGRKLYIAPQRKSLKEQSHKQRKPPKQREKERRALLQQRRERIEKEREEQHNKEVFLEELYNKLEDLNEEHKKQYEKGQLLEQQRFMKKYQGKWQEQLHKKDKQLYERLSNPKYQKALQSIRNK